MNIYHANYDGLESFLNARPAETKDAKQECKGCGMCLEEENCMLQPDRVLLKCGTPLTTTIPETAETGDTFPVASLNLDTDKFRAPCIRFTFAGNLLTAPGTVTLHFQIFRQCKYQAAAFPVGPVWTFSRLGTTAEESNLISFAVCDCDVCEDECCNYSVVATVETLDVPDSIVINNAALTVLVVDQPHC